MTTQGITEFIKKYLNQNIVQGAIMLTGEWGCGKSYYIQNELIPELKKVGGAKCVVLSLYGVDSIAALSKSIYLETRVKKLTKKSETGSAIKIIGKTILKGVSSYFGVDIGISDKDLKQLYESINLNNILIVLEDVERSKLSILEVMGYVNNLVEQDGAKVLLVANESEILKFEEQKEPNAADKQALRRIPTATTKQYITIKEKTVYDTIQFCADYASSIENIIRVFNRTDYDQALEAYNNSGAKMLVEEIERLMGDEACYNLRALKYSCQKTADMLDMLDCQVDVRFLRFILCANAAFAMKLSKDSSLTWTDDIKSPIELGNASYPLNRCCYEYIKKQYFAKEQFKRDELNFLEHVSRKIKENSLKEAWDILMKFYLNSEASVSNAVRTIYNYLCTNEEYFQFAEYGKLANYLIAVRKYIDDENLIEKCMSKIIEKISTADYTVQDVRGFNNHSGVMLWTDEQKKEYDNFLKIVLEHIDCNTHLIAKEIQVPHDVEQLIADIDNNKDDYIGKGAFAAKLDIKGLLNVLPKCEVSLIHQFRDAFVSVYRFVNVRNFLSGDIGALTLLVDGIKRIVASNAINDKIKLLQFEWLLNNLAGIIAQLS